MGPMRDMWHLNSGRKSTIKDKWIRGNPKSQLELDMWQVRGHLTLPLSCNDPYQIIQVFNTFDQV